LCFVFAFKQLGATWQETTNYTAGIATLAISMSEGKNELPHLFGRCEEEPVVHKRTFFDTLKTPSPLDYWHPLPSKVLKIDFCHMWNMPHIFQNFDNTIMHLNLSRSGANNLM
jgi:hypothetical protein